MPRLWGLLWRLGVIGWAVDTSLFGVLGLVVRVYKVNRWITCELGVFFLSTSICIATNSYIWIRIWRFYGATLTPFSDFLRAVGHLFAYLLRRHSDDSRKEALAVGYGL